MDVESFLQYGAMGILLAVLIAVGAFLRWYFKRERDSQDNRGSRQDVREDENRQERLGLSSSLQSLVSADTESKNALTAVLGDLCDEVRGSRDDNAKVSKVLVKLVEGQERHERQANERHRRQMEQSEQMVKALRAMNGE